MTSKDYIGVFDSGVGGISVLRHLRQMMPRERYLYFGDTANAPYGCRPTEEVRSLTMDAVAHMLEKYPVKALVVACNTATAAAIRELRSQYADLIIIGIEPALKMGADKFPGGRIGVMATPVTLREEKFDILMQRFHSSCSIAKIPAPGLVELIEAGKADSQETLDLLTQVLAPYIGRLDALVLGCTHYPFAAAAIRQVLGQEVALLDGSEGTARETKRRLGVAGLLSEAGYGELLLTASGNREAVVKLAESLL